MPTRLEMQVGRLVWKVIHEQGHKAHVLSVAAYMRQHRRSLRHIAAEMFRFSVKFHSKDAKLTVHQLVTMGAQRAHG